MANESISVLKDKDYSFPKSGTSRIYRLLNLSMDDNGNLVCPQSRHIPNKFILNDKGVPKSYVFVSHQDPSVNSNSVPISQKGRIAFLREAQGEIIIYGDRPDQRLLDEALFFHQYNRANKGKDWHIPPRTGEYMFEMVDKKAKAEMRVEQIERETECREIIKNMRVATLRDTYELIFKQSSIGLSHKEVKNHLYQYISDPDNAKAFLVLSQSAQLEAKKVYNEAIEQKIIEESANGNSIVWVKGKEIVCNKLPKKTLVQSIIIFFTTDEGREVFETLKELIEAKV